MTDTDRPVPDKDIVLRLGENFWYDFERFTRASFVCGERNRENQRALIHILAHSIEHGLSLPTPRPGFGRAKVTSLLQKTRDYIDAYEPDRSTEMALAAIRAWAAWQRGIGEDVDAEVAELDAVSGSVRLRDEGVRAGTQDVSAADIRAVAPPDFEAFMMARHSVRQYADRPVTNEEIERAVRAAQQTPSVCNRQTCRVYAYRDARTKEKVLSYQSGNNGFGHEVGVVLIVTSNMEHMNLIGERYQHWIDGGMFAMTLTLALHAQGMGACMLNWSVIKEIDQAMRACAGIPDNEAVITMIGAGHLKDDFKVPWSQRKPLQDVLVLDRPVHMDAPGVDL